MREIMVVEGCILESLPLAMSKFSRQRMPEKTKLFFDHLISLSHEIPSFFISTASWKR
jgi:hypothetical protein